MGLEALGTQAAQPGRFPVLDLAHAAAIHWAAMAVSRHLWCEQELLTVFPWRLAPEGLHTRTRNHNY